LELDENMKKFEWFYNLLKGRKDVKTRVAVLATPDNWKSMSSLSHGQAEFVADAYFVNEVEEWGEIFSGLKILAEEIMEVSPSIGGLGREQTIRFMGALSESKFLSKLGLTVSGEEKGAKK